MLEGMAKKEDMLQRERLKLSSVSHFVQLEKPGHSVILEEPEVIAEEVKWVLENT
jgi:pimeloyl-ACP methyl ester carboxylesterase